MSPTWPKHFLPNIVRDGFGGGRLSTYLIALEAWRRNLVVTFRDPELRLYEISDGKQTLVFNHSRPITLTSKRGQNTLKNKWETKLHLQSAEVPVPLGATIDPLQTKTAQLKHTAETLGYPLAIKPIAGSKGQGVFSGIHDWDALRNAYDHLLKQDPAGQLLVEKHVPGDDYRVLVLGDVVLGACKRIPASVTGDGKRTIEELIEAKNTTRKRNPFLSDGLITPDFELEQRLSEQGLTLASIPLTGTHIALRSVANASAGGDVVDVTESIPEEIKTAAVQAVRSIPGIAIAGVDILYDPSKSQSQPKYTILEINSRPHIGLNMYPTTGSGQDVPDKMLNYLFPDSKRTDHDSDRQLVFSLSNLMQPLRNSSADRVTARPVPEHRLPVRSRFTIALSGHQPAFLKSQRHRLLLKSRKLDISGSITQNRQELRVLLSGENNAVLHNFALEIAHQAGGEVTQRRSWTGRVPVGFSIDI